MNSRRIFFVMVTVLILLTGVAIAGIVLGNLFFQKQSVELVNLKLENHLIEEQQTALLQANKDIERYTELDQLARTIVPQDKDQAKTIRELNKIAADNGITLGSIEFPASNLGQAAPKPTPTEEGSASAKVTTPPLTQVKAVAGITGVYSLDVLISPQADNPVTYSKLIAFLGDLERNRRTAHVQGITITPQTGGGLSFSLTLSAYVKP